MSKYVFTLTFDKEGLGNEFEKIFQDCATLLHSHGLDEVIRSMNYKVGLMIRNRVKTSTEIIDNIDK